LKPIETEDHKPRLAKDNWQKMLPIWIVIFSVIFIAHEYHFDARIVSAGLILLALLTNAFGWMLGLLALMPFIGNPIVKILTLPFIWLLNALGYVVSYIAIKNGYTQQFLNYRLVTMALIIGVIIGYVIGKFI
jgi:hypothetical protein